MVGCVWARGGGARGRGRGGGACGRGGRPHVAGGGSVQGDLADEAERVPLDDRLAPHLARPFLQFLRILVLFQRALLVVLRPQLGYDVVALVDDVVVHRNGAPVVARDSLGGGSARLGQGRAVLALSITTQIGRAGRSRADPRRRPPRRRPGHVAVLAQHLRHRAGIIGAVRARRPVRAGAVLPAHRFAADLARRTSRRLCDRRRRERERADGQGEHLLFRSLVCAQGSVAVGSERASSGEGPPALPTALLSRAAGARARTAPRRREDGPGRRRPLTWRLCQWYR